MKNVRSRLTLFIVSSLIGVGIFSTLTAKDYFNYRNFNRDLTLSHWLVDTANELNAYRFNHQLFSELQKQRAFLQPEHRMNALSHVIQAYGEKNASLLKRRVSFFSKNEKEFHHYAQAQIAYYEKRIQYFAVIAIGLTLSTLLITLLYIQRSLFRPLQDLSRKMVDFLNHRYTYQFTVPEPNEVGHLQATFNSLAQRVLGNMEELKALDRAKSEFLSIASHELRTPLTSIKGSLSLLNSGMIGSFNEKASNLINIAEMETDRLIRLINDILDLAKIEARRFPLNQSWSDLNDLIQKTFEGLLGFSQTAQVRLVAAEEMPCFEACMDKDRIQQVLTNLLSNAIKFSPQNGSVTVECDIDPKDQLIIKVIDQGKGIAPQDQEAIFQQFRQATGPGNHLVKGTGLGLAIAKALVEEHGGTIGVQSTPGEGSIFYFTLPKWRFSTHKQNVNSSSTGVAA